MAQRILLAATALAIAVAALSGCTSDGEEPAATAGAAAADKGEIESFAGLDEGWQGVLRDVAVQLCPTAAGEVGASGEIVNTADEERDLLILVSWLAPDTTDPLLQLQATLADVPAGEQRDWAVSGTLPADAGSCIVGARSGTLAAN